MSFYFVKCEVVVRTCGLTRWPAILSLAKAYGWKPAGTIIDEGSSVTLRGKWSGQYDAMAGQLVTAEDARHLADAIERALTHFPHESEADKLKLQIKTNFWLQPNQHQRSALDWFLKSKNNIDGHINELFELIEFFREGAFRIK